MFKNLKWISQYHNKNHLYLYLYSINMYLLMQHKISLMEVLKIEWNNYIHLDSKYVLVKKLTTSNFSLGPSRIRLCCIILTSTGQIHWLQTMQWKSQTVDIYPFFVFGYFYFQIKIFFYIFMSILYQINYILT